MQTATTRSTTYAVILAVLSGVGIIFSAVLFLPMILTHGVLLTTARSPVPTFLAISPVIGAVVGGTANCLTLAGAILHLRNLPVGSKIAVVAAALPLVYLATATPVLFTMQRQAFPMLWFGPSRASTIGGFIGGVIGTAAWGLLSLWLAWRMGKGFTPPAPREPEAPLP